MRPEGMALLTHSPSPTEYRLRVGLPLNSFEMGDSAASTSASGKNFAFELELLNDAELALSSYSSSLPSAESAPAYSTTHRGIYSPFNSTTNSSFSYQNLRDACH